MSESSRNHRQKNKKLDQIVDRLATFHPLLFTLELLFFCRMRSAFKRVLDKQ